MRTVSNTNYYRGGVNEENAAEILSTLSEHERSHTVLDGSTDCVEPG